MIPKIINYCWFGDGKLGEKEKKCLKSWKVFFPDWEIKLWNEYNFDISAIPYTQEAYDEKKWAFVSDVARLVILYRYGGIYLDTDVEVISNLDNIINAGSFMGIESFDECRINVNPGLIVGAEPGNRVIKDILDTYKFDHFKTKTGNRSKYTIVERTTEILKKYGLAQENKYQDLGYIKIYPKEVFCPMDYETGKLNVMKNTKTIHWFAGSWLTDKQKKRLATVQRINSVIPLVFSKPIGYIYLKLGAAVDILRNKGLKGLLIKILSITDRN